MSFRLLLEKLSMTLPWYAHRKFNDFSMFLLEEANVATVTGDAFGAPKKKQWVVTNADKKANTPAYQKYKAING